MVAGRDARGHVYVLADASLRASPDHWARRAVAVYRQYGADELVAEAERRGFFGAPTFTTQDGELFWGNDRLEQALRWANKA